MILVLQLCIIEFIGNNAVDIKFVLNSENFVIFLFCLFPFEKQIVGFTEHFYRANDSLPHRHI